MDDYCLFENSQLELVKNKFSDYKLVGPVYSIEIKPKQGFLSAESTDLGVCKFRLKQDEKVNSVTIAVNFFFTSLRV